MQISKQYGWGSGSRLNSIGDAVAGSLTTFQYHASGDLTGSIYTSGNLWQWRSVLNRLTRSLQKDKMVRFPNPH